MKYLLFLIAFPFTALYSQTWKDISPGFARLQSHTNINGVPYVWDINSNLATIEKQNDQYFVKEVKNPRWKGLVLHVGDSTLTTLNRIRTIIGMNGEFPIETILDSINIYRFAKNHNFTITKKLRYPHLLENLALIFNILLINLR